jgi:hypothetical protein
MTTNRNTFPYYSNILTSITFKENLKVIGLEWLIRKVETLKRL